jgi:hypothetical protein
METLISSSIDRNGAGIRCPLEDFELTFDVKGTTVTVRRWRR